MDYFKEKIKEVISKTTGLNKSDILIRKPVGAAVQFGDYCFACFDLAKKSKKKPKLLAEQIAEKIEKKTS